MSVSDYLCVLRCRAAGVHCSRELEVRIRESICMGVYADLPVIVLEYWGGGSR